MAARHGLRGRPSERQIVWIGSCQHQAKGSSSNGVIVDLATSGVSRKIDETGRISFRSQPAGSKNERACLVTFAPAGGSYLALLPGDAPAEVAAGFVGALESHSGDRRAQLVLWVRAWATLAAESIVYRTGPRKARRKRRRSTSIHALSGGLPTLGRRR